MVRLNYSVLALIVVADQMLLPMFHVGGMPFKPSYLLLGLALLPRLLESEQEPWQRKRLTRDWQVAAAMSVIVFAGLTGEAWLSANQPGAVHGEAFRSSLIYILAILAFFLGQRASRFQFQWLVYVFFLAAALNFAFIIFQYRLPGWLTEFYYPPGVFGDMTVFEFLRPRGLFGNPNVSAHMISILALFIHLALRHRLLVISSTAVGVGIILFPLLLSAALASRGEFLVAILLGYLNYRVLFGRISRRPGRRKRLVVAAAVGLMVGVAAMQIAKRSEWSGQFARVVAAVVDAETRATPEGGISRPLMTFQYARDRFVMSPVFGTGYGATERYPFDYGTMYFHNDAFRLLVTSGIIGLIAMLWFVWRFAWPLGWPIMIPLVLPGMVNTFMLNVPAFLCYLLLIGVLREQIVRLPQTTTDPKGYPIENAALAGAQN